MFAHMMTSLRSITDTLVLGLVGSLLLGAGLYLVVPERAAAQVIGPYEKLSIGTVSKRTGYASFSARGYIDNIVNGNALVIKVWGRTFTVEPNSSTRFTPSVRDVTVAERLAAYGIGDDVAVSGYISSTTQRVFARGIANYTERTQGSVVYNVKRVLDGTISSVSASGMTLNSGGMTYTVKFDANTKFYDAAQKRIKPTLVGWSAGDSVYGYFMVGGTNALALNVYNRTKTSAASEHFTTTTQTSTGTGGGSSTAPPPPPPPPSL